MMILMLFLMFQFILINKIKKFSLIMIVSKINLSIIYLYMYMYMMNMNIWGSYVYFYYNMGVDLYSWSLILLTLWIYLMMMMVSKKESVGSWYWIYMNIMNFMLILLVLCFLSINMILFYLYFEISLIPVFMLILGWGFQIERVQAGYYMMLYTLFGSMPLLFTINFMFNMNFSLMMMFLDLNQWGIWGFMSLMLGFMIKMPMYMVHFWLPRAHVEAPIMGSMILAGVMLKLGGYGMLRSLKFMLFLSLMFSKYFIIYMLIGGLISCFICLMQVDMKMLVAYSSVVHMCLFMVGGMTFYILGVSGGLLMMIAHGLCSSGLFVLVNINYERVYSRSLYINKGFINYFPSLSLMWFLLCSSNLSFPPSLNLFSEIMILNSLMNWEGGVVMILMGVCFFSAVYTLYLYSYSQHGNFNFFYIMKSISVCDFMVLVFHWIPLNMLFLMMYLFF